MSTPPTENPRSLVRDELAERARPMMDALRRYHRHEVIGLEHMPRTGKALVVFNHSLATYDSFLFGIGVHEATGRWMVGLGDDLIFKTPGLARIARDVGLRPASPDAGHRLLADGHLVGVAPGGMREALKPSDERHTVRWDRRKGFVRLAVETGAPVVIVACPAADDMYTVYPNRLTAALYRRFRLPVPVARGLGLSLLPRPVRLVHLVGAPMVPPVVEQPPGTPAFDGAVDRFHADIVHRMQGLMRAAERR